MQLKPEEVSTGEVKTVRGRSVLTANALGSCIAVVIYDAQKLIGGVAHIMLPGAARDKHCHDKFRFAEDGIEELLKQIVLYGADTSTMQCILAGGANVLKRDDDTICRMNIESVLNILKKRNIPVVARSLGGVKRRRIRLNVSEGTVLCTVGDGGEAVLWKRQ